MEQKAAKKFWKRSLGAGLSVAMALSMLPAVPAKAAETELLKAGSISATEESVTKEQPFASGTAGSYYFRIPAMIVTQDGNLLAAADARYTTTADGGGLDTIASMSTDGGQTWKYSFPLYFPDSNGYAGTDATTIIDSALVQGKDGVIYCIADVNPTGVTTMSGFTSPGAGTGYITVDGKERMALTSDYDNVNTEPADDDVEVYQYYVGDWDEQGYAPVISRADGSASEYAVDKWYNLYSVKGGQYVADLTQAQVNDADTQVQQNVFYRDSVLHVYNTGYLMYAKSTDDGLTWGDPEILNPQIKREGETGLLVSPGKGILTAEGSIVIPFYDHGDDEENASIIWSDDNGATWTRSNDVPGSNDGGYWTSESEVVELNDGTLRMFFRSGQGTVCYADAVRNEEGDYEFSASKSTGVGCTSTCNVTASVYSKPIDGKPAILVAIPGGSGRANGKIFTFLVDEEDGNSMTLKSTYSVPHSASTYAYSCLDELPDGSIGLLWEYGSGVIRYDNFNIMEIVSNGYIAGAEMDIELYAGEKYTREYTVDTENMGIQAEPDASVATVNVERGKAVEKTSFYLHPHIGNEVNSNLSAFSGEADSNLDPEEAEMTITAAEEDGTYLIYNESTGKYLTNTYAQEYFKDEAAAMKIENALGESTFRICSSAGTGFIYFHAPQMNFNRNKDHSDGNVGYEITLLEKQEEISEDDLLPGYRVVSEVTSGKKYLIAYLWNTGETTSVIVLYPTNGVYNQTKLAGEAYQKVESAISTVTITGAGEGQTTATIDNMTYHITCLGNKQISLVPGEKYFIQGAEKGVSADPSIATAEAGTETRKALFDCEDEANASLGGYSKDPNWEINMSGAEFIVDSPEEGKYTIYSPTEEVYLVNSFAGSYFANSSITHSLTPSVENGITSFEICRVSDDNLNGRYVYFFYEKMVFDAVNKKDGFETRGDFGFEFLEKSDMVSDLDPIPGYKLASEIVPGKSYLITEYYDDGIIVLYPRNGMKNQSKLYQEVEVNGVYITAMKQASKTTVTIDDGIVYEVTVENECPHSGDKRIVGEVPAKCEEPGYSGDTYCVVCGEKIQDGEEVPMIGHSWDEGKITKQVTVEEDGETTFTCKNDSSHTYTEAISSYDFAWEELNKAITSAENEAKLTDKYTESTLTELNNAIQAAKGLAADAQKSAVNEARVKLTNAQKALVTKELQEKIDELTVLVNRQFDASEYSEDTYKVLQDAIAKGQAALEQANATTATLKRAIDRINDAIEGLVNVKQIALDNALQELNAKISEVAGHLSNQAAYSAESFAAFKSAYDNAVAVRDSEKIKTDKDVAAVNDALAKLTAAVSGLKAPEQPAPVVNKLAAPAIQKIAVSAAKNGINANITVEAVTGAGSYAVYRVVNGKAALVGNIAAGNTSITDKNLTSRKVSYYAVALDANGQAVSDNGAAKALTLGSATKIKKVSSSKSGIKITWNKAKKATGYIVYRSNKKNGSYTKLASVKKGKSSYTDKKAAKGKTYYYKVVVKTKNNVSLLSAASKKATRKK